jgi:hypothetical protein
MSNRDFVRELYHTAGANDRCAAERANDSAVSSEVEQCREEDRLRTNRHASVLFGTDLQKMDDLIYFALNILRIEKIAEHVDAGESGIHPYH